MMRAFVDVVHVVDNPVSIVTCYVIYSFAVAAVIVLAIRMAVGTDKPSKLVLSVFGFFLLVIPAILTVLYFISKF